MCATNMSYSFQTQNDLVWFRMRLVHKENQVRLHRMALPLQRMKTSPKLQQRLSRFQIDQVYLEIPLRKG